MPIKGDAKKVKDSMEEQYGKEKGEEVFYATANKQGRKPETWKKKGAAETLRAIVKDAKCKRDAKRAPDDDEIAAKHKKEGGVNPLVGAVGGAAGGGLVSGTLGAGAGAAGGMLWYLLKKLMGKHRGDSVWSDIGRGAAAGGLGMGALGAASGAYRGYKLAPHVNLSDSGQLTT